MIKVVVLAGGSGSRLWPMSRAGYPKQFLKLSGDDTMLQATVKRLKGLDISSSVTICNEEHRFFVAEQLREVDELDSIILEPFGRNTAPAIAAAALSSEDDPLLLVLAADHVVEDEVAFRKTILSAIPFAKSGKLVTFGIVPTEPHVGYGYIKRAESHAGGYAVEKFIEKPSLSKAKEYFNSNEYYWNSGMFLFKSSRYLEELKKFRPDIFEACEASVAEMNSDLDFLRLDKDEFLKCPSESIDYAVMENTVDAIVVPLDVGWNDIGSWASLWDISAKDENGNASTGDVILHDTNDCFIRADDKMVATIGVDDLVIVSSKDAVMVAQKNAVQDIKTVIDDLKNKSRCEWEFHRKVYRPWGNYESIDNGDRYQVKRITVKPGEKLSVQMHHHRAEHWIVVSGSAKVENGDNIFILTENQSTFIPVGVKHSLENPGKVDLELIEVQSGSYLGEDDIVRFEDRYGRK